MTIDLIKMDVKRKRRNYLIKLITLTSICVLGFIYILIRSDIGSDKTYTVKDLKANYNIKRKNILEVKKYFDSIAPKDKEIDIEFEGNEIARLKIDTKNKPEYNYEPDFLDWHIPVNSSKTDSLLLVLGWTKNEVLTLKEKLQQADCISINNSEPSEIGFKRTGLGLYYYYIFDAPVTKQQAYQYNDSCSYVLINKNLAVGFAGGAVGRQCFTDEELAGN